MNNEQITLQHDLMVMEEMAANMEAYLISDAKEWTIPRVNMPKLTIGGYLMRQHRLLALEERLDEEGRARLHAAIKQFDAALEGRVVRFEQRAHQELRARISEWSQYLRDLKSRAVADVHHYAGTVDTRVVAGVLVDKLQTPPYHCEEQAVKAIAAYDKNLQGRWVEGEFVWDEVWRPAYPRETYWYLYGHPRVE